MGTKNIAWFGGDPKNVTIFGESAGGTLSAAMLGSPEAKGLFHHAISESPFWMGFPTARWMALAEAEQSGRQVATTLGVTSLAELRAKTAEELLKGGRGLIPIVDGWYIKEDLAIAFAQGRQHEADVLVGSNKDEGTFPAFGLNAESVKRFGSEARERWGDLSEAFFKLYPARTEAESHTSQLTWVRDEMSWQTRNWAELQVRRGKSRAYVYYFTHEPPSAGNQPSTGATHTAEIRYVFNNPPTNLEWREQDRQLAEVMSSYWVNFASNGDPNGMGLPAWPAYKDKATGRAMILGPTVEAETAPDTTRWALYDTLWARQRGPRPASRDKTCILQRHRRGARAAETAEDALLADRLLGHGSELREAHHLARLTETPVIIVANHLSDADANVVEVLLQQAGGAGMANRLTAWGARKCSPVVIGAFRACASARSRCLRAPRSLREKPC